MTSENPRICCARVGLLGDRAAGGEGGEVEVVTTAGILRPRGSDEDGKNEELVGLFFDPCLWFLRGEK